MGGARYFMSAHCDYAGECYILEAYRVGANASYLNPLSSPFSI